MADTRDELTTQAENESSGSAIAAISLLRSISQTSTLTSMVHSHSPNALQPNSSKRNAPPSRRDSTKKAKLGRTTSSIARMQSLPPVQSAVDQASSEKEAALEPEKKSTKASLAVILSPSGGDSDKENWSPDEEGNPIARRRPLPAATAAAKTPTLLAGGNPRRVGRVLGEQGLPKRAGMGGRANTAPVPRSRANGKAVDSSVSIFEDEEGADEHENASKELPKKGKRTDEEVQQFMRGEVSPSKRPDMDCIAGLLSLSQGNWR